MALRSLFFSPSFSLFSASNGPTSFSEQQLRTLNTGSFYLVTNDFTAAYFQISGSFNFVAMSASAPSISGSTLGIYSSSYLNPLSCSMTMSTMSFLQGSSGSSGGGGTVIVTYAARYAYKMRGYNTASRQFEYWTTAFPPSLPSSSYIDVTVDSTWRTS
jgi:hypothetical protein